MILKVEENLTTANVSINGVYQPCDYVIRYDKCHINLYLGVHWNL